MDRSLIIYIFRKQEDVIAITRGYTQLFLGGSAVRIRTGCAVLGAQHMIFATDIVPSVKSPHLPQPILPEALDLIADKAEELGFTGIGRYDIFIHLDMRPNVARWDERTKFK